MTLLVREPAGTRETDADTRRWWTLAGFCVVLFVSVAFKSMVGIAVPDLQRDLGASLGQLQWLLNAYTLVLAALLLTGGALADRYGRRRVYVTGLAVFAAGAVACLLSPDATVLDFSSGLMGVGGGVIFAAGAGLVSVRFTGPERATAFAAVAAASTAAAAFGPLIAGALIDGFGWRGVFAFLAALAVAGLVAELVRGVADEPAGSDGRPLDRLGPLTFAGGIFLAIFVLIRGNDEGFGSAPMVAAAVASVVLLAVFVVSQVLRGRPGSPREPMLDVAVLRRPSVAGAAVAHFVLGFVAFGLSFYLAIYLGAILGNSPTETGLKLLPMTAVAFAAAPVGSWLMRRAPARALVAACLGLIAAGCVLLRSVGLDSEWTALVGGLVLVGLGSGAIVPVVVSTALSVVPSARAGVAAGINNTARQLGIAFGVAGLGSYFQARVASRLETVAGVDADAAAEAVVAGAFSMAAQVAPPASRAELAAAAPSAFFAGLDEVFLLLTFVALAGATVAVALIRGRDFLIPAGGRTSAVMPADAGR